MFVQFYRSILPLHLTNRRATPSFVLLFVLLVLLPLPPLPPLPLLPRLPLLLLLLLILFLRTCDYAQLWESETGYIYSMTDSKIQERFAGAASAKNCSFFTDNGLLEYW